MLYDPLGEYLDPKIQGYRLVNGRYQPIRLEFDGSLTSLSTGVSFRMEGDEIRVIKTASGRPFLRYEELEDENARLRAEIERLRKTD